MSGCSLLLRIDSIILSFHRSKARFLWKRIPATVKTGNVELGKIWSIFNHLWDNDVSEFFKIIDFEWSTNVAKLMAQLKGKSTLYRPLQSEQKCKCLSFLFADKIQEETIDLVAEAYTSIFEDCLCTMLNETPEVVSDLCQARGWEIQKGDHQRLVIPKRKIVEKVDAASAEDQLAKLTDFVSFLEN